MKDLTIDQFFGVLSDKLVVVDTAIPEQAVLSKLFEHEKIQYPTSPSCHLKIKKDFQLYFQDSDTYLPFQSGRTYSKIDLNELISYAMHGNHGLLLAKNLSI